MLGANSLMNGREEVFLPPFPQFQPYCGNFQAVSLTAQAPLGQIGGWAADATLFQFGICLPQLPLVIT